MTNDGDAAARSVFTGRVFLSWVFHLSGCVIGVANQFLDFYPMPWNGIGRGLSCRSCLGLVLSTKRQIKSKRLLRKKPRMCLPILGLLLVSCATVSDSFLLPSQYPCRTCSVANVRHLQTSREEHDTNFITQELLDRARIPLKWEMQNALEAKPVLNLSARDVGPANVLADAAASDEPDHGGDDPSWEDGSAWRVTERRLRNMGVLGDGEARGGAPSTPREFLDRAPQLLRFSADQVAETAHFLISYANTTALISADPSLLTYVVDDLHYGLEEYLPNMMCRGDGTAAAELIRTQLALSPSLALNLVRMGIEGGIVERGVRRALSSASSASSKAGHTIAGDASRSYKEFLKRKRK